MITINDIEREKDLIAYKKTYDRFLDDKILQGFLNSRDLNERITQSVDRFVSRYVFPDVNDGSVRRAAQSYIDRNDQIDYTIYSRWNPFANILHFVTVVDERLNQIKGMNKDEQTAFRDAMYLFLKDLEYTREREADAQVQTRLRTNAKKFRDEWDFVVMKNAVKALGSYPFFADKLCEAYRYYIAEKVTGIKHDREPF
jgi:hypothetical protein